MSVWGQDVGDWRCWHYLEEVLTSRAWCCFPVSESFYQNGIIYTHQRRTSCDFSSLLTISKIILHNPFKQILATSWYTSPSSSHSRGLGLFGLWGPFLPKPFCDSISKVFMLFTFLQQSVPVPVYLSLPHHSPSFPHPQIAWSPTPASCLSLS